MADRVPPNSLDAEAAVLSAVLLDVTGEARALARAVLGEGAAFYADANRRIWDAIIGLDREGKAVDVVTVAAWLRDRGRLAQVGGSPYLAQIADATPAVAHVEAHARIIVGKARQRALVALSQRFASEGYQDVPDVQSWLLEAARAVSDLAGQDAGETEPAETLAELVPRVSSGIAERSRLGTELRGIDTGFAMINRLNSGWTVGLHVLAGRPGMGKTSALLCACMNVARQAFGVVLLSAEMPKEDLVERMLAVESHVDLAKIRTGRMNAGEWASVTAAGARLAKLPMVIHYCPGATVPELRAVVRKESRRLPPLGLVAVDYIQILDGERREADSRETEVAGISKGLLWMSQEFRVPLVAASQLNRAVESRADKRPMLSDLRESGSIEQDAHSVNFLYRDEYYNKKTTDVGIVEWHIAKQRQGPTGMAKLAFRETTTLVATLASDEQRSFADFSDFASEDSRLDEACPS